MSLPVVVEDVAQAEFDEAFDWHDARDTARAVRFAEAVRAVFNRIGMQPRAHGVVYKDVRKALVRGFTYCVYYYEEPHRVVVISVFHSSRDPAHWQGRR
ncbi:MAG: type II toxin-antitoxin system RelE/ParE family toxin [Fimbriiglobus sp.]|jgi:plasmid stabilization system protein ParE|nr:type II toxin-antitoxin system RelE/ParE family toxin [Fimbriiglobus sp.]